MEWDTYQSTNTLYNVMKSADVPDTHAVSCLSWNSTGSLLATAYMYINRL